MGVPLPMLKQEFLSYDPAVDGVTNGILSTFGACREKARLSLKGLTKRSTSFALTYGDLTHWLFQHVYEDHQHGRLKLVGGELPESYIKSQLVKLEALWRQENPLVSAELTQMMELTMMMNERVMPFYFRHWKNEFKEVKWLGLESEFKIPFTVERNGVTYRVFLRGKRDGVFEILQPGRDRGTWLFETKTKSYIDEGFIAATLPFESQVNLYLVALWLETGVMPTGVRYNLVRRPGLRQKKNETTRQFAQRLADDVIKRPSWYFLRQKMRVASADIEKYLGELEDRVWEFCHWWYGHAGHWRESGHCQNKYGTCVFLTKCGNNDLSPYYIRQRIYSELAEEVTV